MRPSEGTLSCHLSAIGDFLINWVIPGKQFQKKKQKKTSKFIYFQREASLPVMEKCPPASFIPKTKFSLGMKLGLSLKLWNNPVSKLWNDLHRRS